MRDSTDAWTHAAVTYDGTTGLLQQYLNGSVVVSSYASAYIGVNPAPLLIGSSGGCSSFTGLIDEVSLYNRALTSEEINAIINAGSAGKCQTVGVDSVATPVARLSLKSVWPNPTRSAATVVFDLPMRSSIRIDVLDLQGRVVRTLAEGREYGPGRWSMRWDCRDQAGRPTASGIYFFRLATDSGSLTRRLVVVR